MILYLVFMNKSTKELLRFYKTETKILRGGNEIAAEDKFLIEAVGIRGEQAVDALAQRSVLGLRQRGIVL